MTELPDFDKLKWLAENKPDELEALRKTLCKEAIDGCTGSNKAQLISMLFNLEQQLSRCSNPYHRCYLAIRIMNDKLVALNTILNYPQEFRQQGAKVLRFPSKHADD